MGQFCTNEGDRDQLRDDFSLSRQSLRRQPQQIIGTPMQIRIANKTNIDKLKECALIFAGQNLINGNNSILVNEFYNRIQQENIEASQSLELLNNIGVVLEIMQQYQKASHYFELAYELSKNQAENQQLPIHLINYAYGLFRCEQYANAQNHYEKAIEIALKNKSLSQRELAYLFNTIGALCYLQNEIEDGQAFVNKSLETWGKMTGNYDEVDWSKQMKNSTRSHLLTSSNDKIIKIFEDSVTFVLANNDNLQTVNNDNAFTLNNIGLVYEKFEMNQKAIDYCQQAFLLKKKLVEAYEDINICHSNIGMLYFKMEWYSEAAEYFQKAVSYLRRMLSDEQRTNLRQPRELVFLLYVLGVTHYKLGQEDKAKQLYAQSQMLSQELADY